MKNLNDLLRDFQRATREHEKLVKELPRIIGNINVKIIKENFQLQGYDSGIGFTRWKERSKRTNLMYDRGKNGGKYRSGKNSNYKGSVFDSRKPILRQTQALYNAVSYRVVGKSVVTGVDETLVPYARIHNEGSKGMAFGRYPFNMPQRQFMPKKGEVPNIKMLRTIEKRLIVERNRIFNQFKK